MPTDPLASWTRCEHTANVAGRPTTRPYFRKGDGPPVVVVHEVPGLTAEVISFGEELVAAGYTVVMPHLFGKTGRAWSARDSYAILPRLCVSREFTVLATGRTTPIAGWLRSLAKQLHEETGQHVGALGMCFAGGFALAMMVDPWLKAPILAQPSVPFCLSSRDRKRGGDVGLSLEDQETVRQRAADGQQVLGMRFTEDPLVGRFRFEALQNLLGEAFISVEMPGTEHSTVSTHRKQEFVDAVLEFLQRNLTQRPTTS